MRRIIGVLIVYAVFPVILGIGVWMTAIASFAQAMKVAAGLIVGAALGEILLGVYGRTSSA